MPRFRLRPRDTRFYDLFDRAGRNLVLATDQLRDLFAAPAADRPALAARLRDIEHEADEVTHAILRQVNQTFVTPFDREDIFRLASRVDDVVDFLEEAGDLTMLYGLDELPTAFERMGRMLCEAAYAASSALSRLEDPGKLMDYFVEANRLENLGDTEYRNFLSELFSGAYSSLAVLKLKGVADALEAAADGFEHVADMVETIAVKET